MTPGTHLSILRAEIAAARIEAILAVEPAVARLWRNEAAFAEAVSSVGLEDVRVQEGDLVARLTVNGTDDGDPRGLEQAGEVLRILRQPGDVLAVPVDGLRRIEAAAAPIGSGRENPQILEDAELREIAKGAMSFEGMPIAGAIRAAADYAWRSDRYAPVAERLIFMAVEGCLRARSLGLAPAPALEDEDVLLGRLDASWIATPSISLTRRGFRIWSPLREGGVGEMAALIAESLAWDLGQIGPLRRHVERLGRAGEGRRGRARHADLAAWIPEHPVFSSAMIMDGIGVTRKTALSLIADFEDSGIISSITPRSSSRLWATASLAERLKTRSARQPREWARPARAEARGRPAADVDIPDDDHLADLDVRPARPPMRPASMREENRESMEKALAELDRMMAEAEGILAGIRPR